MKDMGLMHYFLSLEVWKGDGEIFVRQGKYTSEILKRFHMQDYKPMDTPLGTRWRKQDASTRVAIDATIYKHLVGSLMYLVNARADICFAVNQFSQFMAKPSKLHEKKNKTCSNIPKRHKRL